MDIQWFILLLVFNNGLVIQHVTIQTGNNQYIGYSSWPITFTKLYWAWCSQTGNANIACGAELTIKSSASQIGVKSSVAWFSADAFSIGI